MSESKLRILVIDDSEAIHGDFRRVLCPRRSEGSEELALLEDAIFGPSPSQEEPPEPEFELDSAFQGQEGVAKVEAAQAAGNPYALAFLDYRMPPGWNGLETLRYLRKVAPSLMVILCSAYSDYAWETLIQEFGESERLKELKKPFDANALRHLALSIATSQGSA